MMKDENDRQKLLNIKWIFFDCMETLVDLTELPKLRDYASWAYHGSGVEEYFKGFEDFFQLYNAARAEIAAKLEEDREYEMLQRLEEIIRIETGIKYKDRTFVAQSLYHNYWRNYKARCYVKEDVREVLQELQKRFRLGVVSNFMVHNGIEELLETNGIKKHFEFVVTSINTGWRKPNIRIYEEALKLSGAEAGEILFVGDDYVNDWQAPPRYGMSSILLDRYGKYDKIENRVCDFYDLKKLVL